MQTVMKGYATLYRGTFEDQKEKAERLKLEASSGKKIEPKTVPYHQLCITEKTDKGVNLLKASVPAERVADAALLDDKHVQILCDLVETNYNGVKAQKLVFLEGKPLAKAA